MENFKQNDRRRTLMNLWTERHEGEEMNELEEKIMECLILLGEQYDKDYSYKSKEFNLYRLSNGLRNFLGINIQTKDKSVVSPKNENKKLDK